MFIQSPQIPSVPKKELLITLPYLGKMSQIVKTRLRLRINTWNFVNWELFSKLVIDLETTFAAKTLFMKPYGQIWFINSRTEVAQLPKLVRPIDTSE